MRASRRVISLIVILFALIITAMLIAAAHFKKIPMLYGRLSVKSACQTCSKQAGQRPVSVSCWLRAMRC